MLALFVPNVQASKNPEGPDKTVKIGLLIHDNKSVAAKHGAEMAVRKANEKGGFNGRPFQLVVHSMEGPWGTGSKEAVNLIFEEKVWAIMGSHDGRNADLVQARKFLESLDLELFLEPIEVEYSALDWKEAVKVVEDYKPLDIQSATMNLSLLQGIRSRYPDWKYIIDGDGGDENLKDYPIEENPELTIRSVLNNLMFYHEGWGVESIKHSLTYSGGLSRGYMRTYATMDMLGFKGFSPYTLPNVIEISEGIPYIDMTNWDHQKLYDLKGQIVSHGVKAITGMEMPVFPKRRFQHGATSSRDFKRHFPEREIAYRKEFLSNYE